MALSKEPVVLQAAEAERLLREYREMSELVQCQALRMQSAWDLIHRKPEMSKRLKKSVEEAHQGICAELDRFQVALETVVGRERK